MIDGGILIAAAEQRLIDWNELADQPAARKRAFCSGTTGIANPLPAKYAEITGNKTIASTNKLLRRTRAQVSEWGIGYPK